MENIGLANALHCASQEPMENIGQAHIFHELLDFYRFRVGPVPGDCGKP